MAANGDSQHTDSQHGVAQHADAQHADAQHADAQQSAMGGKCRVREILDRVGDKWSLLVIFRLGAGPQRFTELKRSVDGVSQRMLTVTLRGLERDGIVTRTVFPVVPPRVDYELTKMGQALLDAVGSLMSWADAHLDEIDAARVAYDARVSQPVLLEASPL